MPILDPTAEWTNPNRHIGRRILYYDRISSALTVAASLATEPGSAILAGEQTAGRGQYGRSWQSPPGTSVLLAVVLAPPPPARRPAVLTAWAAVGVAQCIRRLTGIDARIKWPNDVLVDGKKVCGILIETIAGSTFTAVAGIGLNVKQSADDFAAAGLPDATSLAASSGKSFETREVAEILLEELDEANALLGDHLALLERVWAERIGLLGQIVKVETTDGTNHVGRLTRLAFDGLELEVGGSIMRLVPEAIRSVIHGPVGRSPTQHM